MTELRPPDDAPLFDAAARRSGIRESVLLGLVLFTLVRTSEALAGDQGAVTLAPGAPQPGGTPLTQWAPSAWTPSAWAPSNTLALSAPALLNEPMPTANQEFSTTEFRPRKHTVFDSDPAAGAFGDAPMLRGTTVWQRMSDYRSHDRVRVLTLWETSGSTVSLQAGKRGDPSLQWTSRAMNHGGSTRGLLDRLLPVSLARIGGSRGESRSVSAAPAAAAATPAKQSALPVVAGLK
jgi:hypothetical protein